MNNKNYVSNLENIIKQMLKPLKNVPLSLVIEGVSGKKILPFDNRDSKDITLLKNLIKIADKAGRAINEKGIERARANEVGNDIEYYVKKELNNFGYQAEIPKSKKGNKKSMGYPDIEFIDNYQRTNYLECKTYNINNINTAQRSFYLSPSEEFKITKDAHHFVISYEVYISDRKGRNNIYKCKSWKILSLESLNVDVKYEFNCDNRRLYTKELILAEGEIK
jgi:hypothetical protein